MQPMNWGKLAPPKNLHTWILVLISLSLLSLAAFTITITVGLAVTGVLTFFLAYLTRSDEKPTGQPASGRVPSL